MTLSLPQDMQRAAAAYRRGEWAEAERLCRAMLDAKRDSFAALHLLGIITAQTGRPQESVALLSAAVSVDPNNAGAYNNRGNVLRDLKRPAEALDSYERALALKPGYAEAYNNRGNVLRDLKRHAEALDSYEHALAVKPDYAEAFNNRGVVLRELTRHAEALESYDRALALKPGYPEAHNNRGNVLRDLKRHAEALQSYERALALKPAYVEAHNNRGNVLRDLAHHAEALESYERALAQKPDCVEAYENRGIVLRELKRHAEALASYEHALALKPDSAEAHNNRGNVLRDLKRHAEALESYERALALKADNAEAHYNRGIVLSDMKRHAEALASYEHAIALKAELPFLYGNWLHAKMQICAWDDVPAAVDRLVEKIERREKAAPPFALLAASGSPAIQRMAAEIWVESKCPANHASGKGPDRSRHDRIRIGYFSADFREHAVSNLIAELFERHDKSRFELTAFSLGPDTGDAMRQRVAAAFDRFIDVRDRSDADVAMLARELEIDIAVDLNGFTRGNRTEIFAMRAAPIQVNYLGYAGTMGAEYIDYLIADSTLIPESHRQYYAEKVVYLPDSFQVNDTQRRIADKAFTRQEAGLPREGFVYCCFNSNYKITPAVFDCWMRILDSVEGSVLWLWQDNEWAAGNLRKEAANRGIGADRLIFAQRVPSTAEHLARYRLADLFLDTQPFNAHTTASDALWAGLPVLTCLGEAYAGRVAASLLYAVGLPELITRTSAEYESLAIALATCPDRLSGIRQELVGNRLTAPLFDIQLFARHMEAAYTTMYERHRAGLPPDHICVRA